MNRDIVSAAEKAISLVVTAFQNNTTRFWNERDIHWSLFYYLRQENVIPEIYPTELIRAEFPTLNKYPNGNPVRGHYDLVVFDAASYRTPAVQAMKSQTDWDEFLPLVNLTVAVEIKLWLARLKPKRADWDVEKLTEQGNKVVNAFFLNFVQLDFNRKYNQDYYRNLLEHLVDHKITYPDLSILCVPSEKWIQPDSSDNWL